MVTDRVGPTITTLKAEVDYLGGEVKKLSNLLTDARTENMRLRAALLAFADHFGPLEGNPFLHEDALRCFALARAALEGKHD